MKFGSFVSIEMRLLENRIVETNYEYGAKKFIWMARACESKTRAKVVLARFRVTFKNHEKTRARSISTVVTTRKRRILRVTIDFERDKILVRDDDLVGSKKQQYCNSTINTPNIQTFPSSVEY